MTKLIKLKSPSAGSGKDPNDTRDNPEYRKKLEEDVKKKPARGGDNSRGVKNGDPLGGDRGLHIATTWERPAPINDAEWMSARLAPDCIVDKYLYADVGVLVAAGGTGKTTLILYEAVHVVLGRNLYGREVVKPGNVLILTAEDRRELLTARLREICIALDLTGGEMAKVRQGVEISDHSGEDFRLTSIERELVTMSGNVDNLVNALRDDPPVLIVIDPLVSFGVGENRINDAEQALVMAARHVVRELGCCVRYVHHTGQQSARDKLTDAYAGRGGSALPDGCRMVAVLVPCEDNEQARPAHLDDGQTIKLGLPKTSYCKKQLPIWIARNGYEYGYANELPPMTAEETAHAKADQLERFLVSQLNDGCYHTNTTLDGSTEVLSMTRNQVRAARAHLTASGRIAMMPLPDNLKHGGRQQFLCPIHLAEGFGGVESKGAQK